MGIRLRTGVAGTRWRSAAALALSGVVTSRLAGGDLGTIGLYLAGVPFALASASFCARWKPRFPVVLLGDALAWVASYQLALALYTESEPYFAFACAGGLGALLVAGSTAVAAPRLRAWRPLLLTTVAGALCGLPFPVAISGPKPEAPLADILFPMACFVLWQVVVGLLVLHSASPGGAAE